MKLTLVVAVASLFALSCGLNVFLLKQASFSRKQAEELTKYVTDYENTSVPLMTDFMTRLQAYARTNLEFSGILARYNITPSTPIATQLRSVTSAQPVTLPATNATPGQR